MQVCDQTRYPKIFKLKCMYRGWDLSSYCDNQQAVQQGEPGIIDRINFSKALNLGTTRLPVTTLESLTSHSTSEHYSYHSNVDHL